MGLVRVRGGGGGGNVHLKQKGKTKLPVGTTLLSRALHRIQIFV